MSSAFSQLSGSDLTAVVRALRAGRLTETYPVVQLSSIVPKAVADSVRDALLALKSQGFNAAQVAALLETLLSDREHRDANVPSIELVTSGPEAPGVTNRDTSVVVRELFAHAERSVPVVGYAVYQGQQVFESLAKRMEESPDLDVRFFLNINRPDSDDTKSKDLVARFKQRFKDKQWPAGHRLPEVYYDPRSVADDEPIRSSLHAKCVVVDAEKVFVSSANFTEAGQKRNIEVGLLIDHPWLAKRITQHFGHLQDSGLASRAL